MIRERIDRPQMMFFRPIAHQGEIGNEAAKCHDHSLGYWRRMQGVLLHGPYFSS